DASSTHSGSVHPVGGLTEQSRAVVGAADGAPAAARPREHLLALGTSPELLEAHTNGIAGGRVALLTARCARHRVLTTPGMLGSPCLCCVEARRHGIG